MLKIALVQMSMSDEFEANIEKSLGLLEEAAADGANVVTFPELQFSPFFPQYEDRDASHFAIDIGHEAVQRFQAACKRLGVVAVPNFYLEEGGNRFDASPVINADGQILGVSKMVHIVQMQRFYEQNYYTPSDSGFKVYETPFGKIGIVICFDRHFPESFRSCALQGAQFVIIPTANLKNEPLDVFEWEVRIAAMHNSFYVALCNRVGLEGEVDFCGGSLVADPNGGLVAKADEIEHILYADYDLDLQARTAAECPFIPLRRPEAYFQS
jgi:predicted amidohydrolase